MFVFQGFLFFHILLMKLLVLVLRSFDFTWIKFKSI